MLNTQFFGNHLIGACTFCILLSLISFNTICNENAKFNQLTTDDGLSSNIILSMIQDSVGFMWFGTADGLNRYDGNNFKVFKSKPGQEKGLRGNVIRSLHIDKNGNIWIGSDQALNVYISEFDIFKSFRYQKGQPGILEGQINYITEDIFGNIWACISGEGISALEIITMDSIKFHNFSKEAYDQYKISDNIVNMIKSDSQGNIWYATSNEGISKMIPGKKKENRFEKIENVKYTHKPDDINSLSNIHVNCIYIDKDNNVWCGTPNGLNIITPDDRILNSQNDSSLSFSSDIEIKYITEHGNNLWLSTNKGLYRVSDFKLNIGYSEIESYLSDPFDPYSINSNQLDELFIDKSEILWISGSKGLNKLDLNRKQFYSLRNNLNNNNSLINSTINALFEENEDIVWIGTNNGLDRYDKSTGNYTHFINDPENNSISSGSVFSLTIDDYRNLWIGTSVLDRFDLAKYNEENSVMFERFAHDPSNPNTLAGWAIFHLYNDDKDIVWASTTTGGLTKIENPNAPYNEMNFINYGPDKENMHSLSSYEIWCTLRDRSGRFWIGTNSGLDELTYNSVGEVIFKHYINDPKDSTTISPGSVKCICEPEYGSSNILWIGTEGGGLNKLDKTRNIFTHITEQDGLANNSVWGILEDNSGNLWISTNQGISKFNPKNESFTNYSKDDGLQNNKFNMGAYHKGRSGCFYFGGDNGVNYFFPDSIQNNSIKPEIVITNLFISNVPVKAGDTIDGDVILPKALSECRSIELSFRQNDIALEFAALHYASPASNQLKYKLNGFDKKWRITDSENNKAVYTNLQPGQYFFQVIGSNNDNVWNSEGQTLEIIMTPPFWKTIWFIASTTILTIFMIILIIKQREKKLRKDKHILEEKIQKGLSEINKQKEEVNKFETKLKEKEESTKHQKWHTEGMILFTGIMNKYKDNIKFLIRNILKSLISYVEAEQGAIFLVNNDDVEKPFLELISSYAFDKRRKDKKNFDIGEGHIGTCFKEKEMIYLEDVPSSYTKISSGLGESSPKYLLFVPIKRDIDTVGVIEIGSFREIENYKRRFIEELCEHLTSNIGSIHANMKLEVLYMNSQEQAKKMKIQEEEMRSHLKKLEATREQAINREKELSELTEKYARKEQNLMKKMLKVEKENLALKQEIKKFQNKNK